MRQFQKGIPSGELIQVRNEPSKFFFIDHFFINNLIATSKRDMKRFKQKKYRRLLQNVRQVKITKKFNFTTRLFRKIFFLSACPRFRAVWTRL